MKISKVNHSRTAVAKDFDKTLGGFIYQDPGSGTQNLVKRLERLNGTASGLYNVFTTIQVGSEPSEPDKNDKKFKDDSKRLEVAEKNYAIKKANFDRRKKYERKVNEINKVVNDILFEKIQNKYGITVRGKLLSPEQVISNLSETQSLSLTSHETNEYVSLCIRKSLMSHKENAVCFLMCIGKDNIIADDKAKIKAFIELVKKDYNKVIISKDRYVRAIKNQNMLVQPVQMQADSSSFALSIPKGKGKKNNNKTEDRQGLSSFLINYAVLDEDSRLELLRKLRRIIDLYFAAPDTFDKDIVYPLPDAVSVGKFNVWERHEEGKNKEGFFVEIPEKLTVHMAIDKIEKDDMVRALDDDIRNKNMTCYRYALSVINKDRSQLFFDKKSVNKFWVHHIEDSVERILNHMDVEEVDFKLRIAYLSEKVWKDALNYLSTKYVSIGKAVFNFGMADLNNINQDRILGSVPESIKEGIYSFDYEMIKARETFQRETAVNVMFAANTLARATVDLSEDSDFLLFKKNDKDRDDIEKYRLEKEEEDLLRNILQFFGGISNWDRSIFEKNYGPKYAVDFLYDLKECIYVLRNESFHFASASKDSCKWNHEFIGKLFEIEAARCISIEKDKFYSNNLPLFYDEKDLQKTLDRLYEKECGRASQIPAFNNVVVRKKLPDFLNIIKADIKCDDETKDKWQSAVYYLLKEIYYNDFIQSKEAKRLFIDAVNESELEAQNKEQGIKRATENFKKRIIGDRFDKGIANDCSLAEICQTLMTEYNYQNTSRTVRSGKDSLFDKELFKHYKLLLHVCLAKAFGKYINKNVDAYSYLKKPVLREKMEKEAFLPEWKSNKYGELIKKVQNNANLQAWYVMGHFLNSRMLNLLAGSMRSFIQYVESIKGRARNTKNTVHKNEDEMVKAVKDICRVIETCQVLSSTVSNNIYDYFKDEKSYVSFVKQFTSVGDLSVGEIFYNKGGVPIVNRNVIAAKLFAPTSILQKIVNPITKDDIEEYHNKGKKIASYKIKKECSNKEEQLAVIDYQRIKNKVEFRTLVEYSEVINELLGQLVNWSYIRERDLLYFQLGFHYMCLNNKSAKAEEYKTITLGNGNKIEGAILYQIAALHVFGIDMYAPSSKDIAGKLEKKSGDERRKKEALENFSVRLTGNGDSLYNAGLELFDIKSERTAIKFIRNYIDHFKYYNCSQESKESNYGILDLYSEVFDRYFTYDMKYQKNVPNMLYNILMKHNIITNFRFATGKKYTDDNPEKARASIIVTKLESDIYTYKYTKDGKSYILEVSAKNEEYIKTIAKILTYPDDIEIKTIVGPIKEKCEGNNNQRTNKNHSEKKHNNVKNR